MALTPTTLIVGLVSVLVMVFATVVLNRWGAKTGWVFLGLVALAITVTSILNANHSAALG